MDSEIKAKWLEALRSDEYRQGRLGLRRDDAFCCLGVLCDVLDANGWKSHEWGESWNGDAFSLSPETLRRIGMSDEQSCTLIDLNDRERLSFGRIADHVEENL